MENNFFESKINSKIFRMHYLFESEDWKETHKLVNLFIKKILCTSDKEKINFL